MSDTVATAPHASSLAPDTAAAPDAGAAPSVGDPYFGLLSDPPGLWSITSYGTTKMVVLQGSPEFHRKAHTLLDSFGGGRHTGNDRCNIAIKVKPIMEGIVGVPITEGRLLVALETYLWCHLWKAAIKVPVLDDEGYIVDTILEDGPAAALQAQAKELALSFYTRMMAAELPCDPSPDRGDGLREARWVEQRDAFHSTPSDDYDGDDGILRDDESA